MKNSHPHVETLLPNDTHSKKLYKFGYICRVLLALYCTTAFAVFISESLSNITQPKIILNIPYGILISVITVTFFGIMGISKRLFISFGTVGICGTVLWFITVEKPFERLMFYYIAVHNTFLNRLTELGFKGMEKYIFNRQNGMRKLGLTLNSCLNIAYAIVITLFAMLFCICLLKKVRLIPIIAVGSAICTLFLYYGMPSGNVGFAMILSALCAVTVLCGYESIYVKKRSSSDFEKDYLKLSDCEEKEYSKKISSIGGFVGFSTLLICSALLIVPANIQKSMNDIPAISEPAAKLENYFFSLVNGHNPDFGSLLFSGVSSIDKRSTALSERSYSGTHVFTVSADTENPIYLRNWVGTDYYDDSWHSPSYEEIAEYKEQFGDGFSSELLTSELLWAMNEDLVTLDEGKSYKDHSNLGYVTEKVNIKKFRATANLIYLPSYTDQRVGLLEYGSYDKSDFGYQNYSDGIFSSTSYVFLDEYSTISNIQLLYDPYFAQNLYDDMSTFAWQADELIKIVNKADGSEEKLKAALKSSSLSDEYVSIIKSTGQIGTKYESVPYRYVYKMDESERSRILAAISNTSSYNDYVYETYLNGCENFESFETLARSIVFENMPSYGEMDIYSAINLKVRKIIDYLSENMTYTLTPKEPSADREYVNSAETFLFDTHEGYCVQFATAAVMLIRSLGIPARYAEGYIANNFEREKGSNNTAKYTSKVLDKNAHAWVEVYFDSFGWIQYEVTTPYMSNMYKAPAVIDDSDQPAETLPPDTEAPSETVTTAYTEPITTDMNYPTEPDVDTSKRNILPAIIIVLSIAAIIIFFKLREAYAKAKFEKLRKSAETSNACAKELNIKLFKYLKHCGLAPHLGEQMSDFSKRVDRLLANTAPDSFENVNSAVMQIEFSNSHSIGNIKMVSGYCRYLRDLLLCERNIFIRIWRKYIIAI